MTKVIFSFNLPRSTGVTKPLPIDPRRRFQEHPAARDRLMLRIPNALETERAIWLGSLDPVGIAANLNNMKAQADLEAIPQGVRVRLRPQNTRLHLE